ncbi:MAG: hypothetical protein ACKVRO_06740 [Micropepsaceae bacterium]
MERFNDLDRFGVAGLKALVEEANRDPRPDLTEAELLANVRRAIGVSFTTKTPRTPRRTKKTADGVTRAR